MTIVVTASIATMAVTLLNAKPMRRSPMESATAVLLWKCSYVKQLGFLWLVP